MPLIQHNQPKPPLRDFLALEALRAGDDAPALRPGLERDAMLRRARLVETASHIDDWLASSGLQAPR